MPASSQSPILNVVNSSRQSTANLALVSFEFRTTSMQTRKILEQSWLVSLHRCIPNFLSSTLRTDRCVLSQTALPPLFILRVSISHRVAGSTLERILDSSLSSLPCTPRSFVCHSSIISASIPLADSRCSNRCLGIWKCRRTSCLPSLRKRRFPGEFLNRSARVSIRANPLPLTHSSPHTRYRSIARSKLASNQKLRSR